MILLELFSGRYSIRHLERDEIEEVLGELLDGQDIVRAYDFLSGPKRIITYFSLIGPNKFDCSFAEITGNPYDYPYKFAPTGTGDQFKVYGAVAQSIREFIDEYSPDAITMLGTTPQQSNLYARATKRVQLPPGYSFKQEPGRETITIIKAGSRYEAGE